MSELQQRFIKTDDGFAVQTYQNVADYLRANERMYAENQTNKNSSSWRKDTTMGWHKASIPEVMFHQFLKEFQKMRNLQHPPKWNDPEFKIYLYKKLRDAEFRKLRVDGRKD